MFNLKTVLQWVTPILQMSALAALAVISDRLTALDMSAAMPDSPLGAALVAAAVAAALRGVNWLVAKLPS